MNAPSMKEILDISRQLEGLLFETEENPLYTGINFRKMPPTLLQLLLKADRALRDAAIFQLSGATGRDI